MKTKGILIGADPELFAQHTKTGAFLSVHDLLQGTKKHPVLTPGGAMQVDGVAAEFNVEPTDDADEFIQNINKVFGTMQRTIQHRNPNLILVAQPTAHFDRTYFDSLPDEVKELGCDPDYNAWTGQENPRPDANRYFRTGGGHIHLGWRDPTLDVDEQHRFDCAEMIQQLDAALYPPSMIWDKDRERQQLYGKKGAHRPKKYGVEYRSLSNAWLRDPAIIEWMFYSTNRAWQMQEDGMHLPDLPAIADTLHHPAPDDVALRTYVKNLETWEFPAFPAGYVS